MGNDNDRIVINLKRALHQYENLPQHSTDQEIAFWNIEQAIDDLSRSSQMRTQGILNVTREETK